MRAVVQRVTSARLTVNSQEVSRIGPGILVFLGLEKGDTWEDLEYMAEKILGLRILEDGEGKMNLSVRDLDREVLLVSQFTLLGDVRRGKRPGFDQAMPPGEAQAFFARGVEHFRSLWPRIQTGIFAADMTIEAVNQGPVTIIIDSRKRI